MNARVHTEPATEPQATSKHDAMVLDIATRLQAIGAHLAESITMSPEDQAEFMGQLKSQLNHEYMRIGSARDTAYEFARIESEEAAEAEWERTHGGISR